ncbi:MAG: hypothetical protein IJ906_11985 [Oscillospiraceae bacterium]|nr:hypothetical protein [Oscillospiraceae bacterium]
MESNLYTKRKNIVVIVEGVEKVEILFFSESTGISVSTVTVGRKSGNVKIPEAGNAAVKEWKNCGVEREKMGKILWNSGSLFFNTVETGESGFVGKSGNRSGVSEKFRMFPRKSFNTIFNTLWKTRWKPV